MKMDSRIPKPSGSKKQTSSLFDFKTLKNFSDQIGKKTPLSEINNLSFDNRRAKSPDFRSEPIVVPKLRRSKSAMDFRTEAKGGMKRFQTGLETIPSKRLKTGGISKPATKTLPIRTQEKRTAILNTLRSASSGNVLVSQAKKPPLNKTTSNGAPSTSRLAAAKPQATAATKAPVATKPPVQTKNAIKNIAAKSRPAPYDYKARHALLLEKFNDLKTKNEATKEQASILEEQNELAEQREKELKTKIQAIEQELAEAQTENNQLKSEILALQTSNGQLKTKNTALAASLTETFQELGELKIEHEKMQQKVRDYESLQKKANTLEASLAETTDNLSRAHDQLYQTNYERLVLHNQVQELRGNIRVFARVRPPIWNEEEKALCGWSFIDETSLEILSNEVAAAGRKPSKHDFAFDQVFNPHTTQEEIFEMVSPLIQSAMDGFNVCIFAYGQTGSGKTFTMEGAPGNLGIIPRTVKLLFNAIKSAAVLGWTYKISASFLEIYNEVLYDLLSNANKDVEIRMANAKSKLEIYVSNLTEEVVDSENMLYDLMKLASSNRATASTAGNERSSRSHAVTRLELVGTHATRPESLIGFINLVDLAGSESAKTSTRMEETKSINRSLSELSNVILALVQKNEHVPYRNSKLTHLLMPCLGGNSKTLMFVNVSPFQENFLETVKSLRFASQVNSCKLAKAKRNKQLMASTSSSSVL